MYSITILRSCRSVFRTTCITASCRSSSSARTRRSARSARIDEREPRHANLLYSRTLDEHPDLRIILPHAGGAIPYLAHRLTYGPTISARLTERAPRDLIASLRRPCYDTAMSASEYALPSLRSLVEPDHILFGTDYPFTPEDTTVQTIEGITGSTDPPLPISVTSRAATRWNSCPASRCSSQRRRGRRLDVGAPCFERRDRPAELGFAACGGAGCHESVDHGVLLSLA
jgi:Amidohydrolase